MKKTIKIMVILLLAIMVFNNISFATYTDILKSEISTIDNAEGDSELNTSAKDIVGAIITITRIIAVGIALIILVVLAMKYMMAAPGDKADIKKHAVVYVVGAVVLFGASGILGIIADFAVTNIS